MVRHDQEQQARPRDVAPSESTPLLRELAASDVQETRLSTNGAAANKLTESNGGASRQVGPDLLRGLLVALMALDHTSVAMGGYPHGTSIHSETASQMVTQFSPAVPFTMRTLTHLCAPGFSMLIGLGLVYFTASRARQGWTARQQIRHILIRALFILLVNTLSLNLVISASSPTPVYIVNIVLWALAIDYVVVGFLGLFLVTYLEPFLCRCFLSRRTTVGEVENEEGEEQQTLRETRAADLAWHTINAGLLILSALSLWINIWSSPHQGECEVATTKFSSNFQEMTAQPSWDHMSMLATKPSDEVPEQCSSTSKILWNFIFQQVSCPGIMSGFPPAGWISFVLFGYLYGRLLLNGGPFRRNRPVPVTNGTKTDRSQAIVFFNLTLSVIFALLFVSTRLLGYGNLSTNCLHTAAQSAAPSKNPYLASFKSFLYIVKYPPSPAFAFFTLFACFTLLALFGFFSSSSAPSTSRKVLTSPYNPLLVYGNQPLFFYGIHFYYLSILRIALRYVAPGIFKPQDPKWARDGTGIGLGWTYVGVYTSCLLFTYAACKWYSGWKRSAGSDSVWKFL